MAFSPMAPLQTPSSIVPLPIIARKPVAPGFESSMRIVTPSTCPGTYCHGMLTPPQSPTDEKRVVEGAHYDKPAPSCTQIAAGPLAGTPPPESHLPTLPQVTHPSRQRQQSAPEPQRQILSTTHARSLSFDPSLTFNKAQRHPHEHGKITGFRTRGTNVKWEAAIHRANDSCADGASLNHGRQPVPGGAIVRNGQITPPLCVYGTQTQQMSSSAAPYSSSTTTKSFGTPVPPKEFTSRASNPAGKQTISAVRTTPASSTTTVKSSAEEAYAYQLGQSSFFYDSDEDNALQRLRKVATGFRKSRSGNSRAETSLGRFVETKATSRRRWSVTEKLRQAVLCVRTDEGIS